VEESETTPSSPKLKDGSGIAASDLNSPVGSLSQSFSARSNGLLRSPTVNLNNAEVGGGLALLDVSHEDLADNDEEVVGIEHEIRVLELVGDDDLSHEED